RMRMLAAAAVLLLAVSAACDDDSPSVPSSAAVADGTGFGLIHASDGKTVTWDPVDYLGDACKAGLAEGDTYQAKFTACYRNPDTRLRTAPLDPATRVVVWPGGDPKRTVGADRLGVEISATAGNDVPPQYRVWRIAVSAGRVVAIEQATF
ncbi:MAG: hypothetical protein JWN31_1495, partial [Frankiales bacterium]|nr:hypothetical protein [Frankiales bacterium]